MRVVHFSVLSLLLFIVMPIQAQQAPIIAATNLNALQSVAQVDFETLESSFSVGQFVMSADASVIATYDDLGTIHLFDGDGALQAAYPLDFPDVDNEIRGMALAPDGDLLVALVSNAYVYAMDLASGETQTFRVRDDLNIAGTLQAVWINDAIWLEAFDLQSGATVIHQLPEVPAAAGLALPYAPEQDFDAVVRIGRIPLPYVVTSSDAGIVKLWDVQTGSVLHEVDNGTGQPAVFGNINAEATQLVWRDTPNQSLYVLDFVAGTNRHIADLGGAYAQWLFLSRDGSAIIAVGYDGQPNVVAWDTASGVQRTLGDYRPCSRPQPDTAQLSRDGTTLVIGCDTGLDIWRISTDA